MLKNINLKTNINQGCYYCGLVNNFAHHLKQLKLITMKRRILLTLTLVLTFGIGLMAQNLKTEKVKVYGNCGMCEQRIDKAAKSVTGVSKASWDKSTMMLEVTYDPSKTSVEKIQTAVAKVGHDTDAVKADDKTYSSLPQCCKYDRPKK